MMADLWRRKLLFKTKTQPANNNSDHGGDEWHNTKVDGRMHNCGSKIVDLVSEHLPKKKKSE